VAVARVPPRCGLGEPVADRARAAGPSAGANKPARSATAATTSAVLTKGRGSAPRDCPLNPTGAQAGLEYTVPTTATTSLGGSSLATVHPEGAGMDAHRRELAAVDFPALVEVAGRLVAAGGVGSLKRLETGVRLGGRGGCGREWRGRVRLTGALSRCAGLHRRAGRNRRRSGAGCGGRWRQMSPSSETSFSTTPSTASHPMPGRAEGPTMPRSSTSSPWRRNCSP